MLRRLGFFVFIVCGGFILYPFKWLLMGTHGGRQRKKLLKQQKRLLHEQAAEPLKRRSLP